MFRILKGVKLDFISKVKPALVISLIVISAGVFYFIRGGEGIYGLDFSGGQLQEYKFKSGIDLSRIRALLRSKGISNLSLFNFSSQKNTVAIKSSQDISSKVEAILNKEFSGKYEILRVEKVGPVVGRILRKKALMAIVFAIAGILLYVTFRFRHFDFGLAAVIALFHDVLIAFAFLLFFSYKVDLLIVTAFLTIAGYSINDTIVVYDRIRELTAKMHKFKLVEVINMAINQTLSRTIITSLTTILVVLALFIFGSSNLKGFSFALIVGFIAGTYSSVFIASPLVILLRHRPKG